MYDGTNEIKGRQKKTKWKNARYYRLSFLRKYYRKKNLLALPPNTYKLTKWNRHWSAHTHTLNTVNSEDFCINIIINASKHKAQLCYWTNPLSKWICFELTMPRLIKSSECLYSGARLSLKMVQCTSRCKQSEKEERNVKIKTTCKRKRSKLVYCMDSPLVLHSLVCRLLELVYTSVHQLYAQRPNFRFMLCKPNKEGKLYVTPYEYIYIRRSAHTIATVCWQKCAFERIEKEKWACERRNDGKRMVYRWGNGKRIHIHTCTNFRLR